MRRGAVASLLSLVLLLTLRAVPALAAGPAPGRPHGAPPAAGPSAGAVSRPAGRPAVWSGRSAATASRDTHSRSAGIAGLSQTPLRDVRGVTAPLLPVEPARRNPAAGLRSHLQASPTAPGRTPFPRSSTLPILHGGRVLVRAALRGPTGLSALAARLPAKPRDSVKQDLDQVSAVPLSLPADESPQGVTTEPAPPVPFTSPGGSTLGSSGHGSGGSAAFFELQLLFLSLTLCVRRRVTDVPCPLSPAYAPLVPPG